MEGEKGQKIMKEAEKERIKNRYFTRHSNALGCHPNNSGSYGLYLCALFLLAFIDTCLCVVLIYLYFEQS